MGTHFGRWLFQTASVCLGLDWGGPAPHCWQGWTSLFGYPSRWWRPAKDQRSPLRRCFKPRPLRRAGCAGFASSCRSDVLKSFRSLGGWPASCPATYRSTHGHRHVRNWARMEIIYLDRESTPLIGRVPATAFDQLPHGHRDGIGFRAAQLPRPAQKRAIQVQKLKCGFYLRMEPQPCSPGSKTTTTGSW